MKITEIYHQWSQVNTYHVYFVRQDKQDSHRIRGYTNITKASRDRYIALLNSSNVVYYSRSTRRYITTNALKVGA